PFSRTVRIDIYDAAGRRVLKLAEEYFTRGTHDVEWAPGGDVASGIYFCRLKAGFTEKTIKIVRLR
ncbi:MAG: T9SS type A sorting domain-containing protein, partial [Candidatus Krumholzibacteria bacterium]|nr:T9SS type A sorting domain-containing protein [Candidatus Krumholzibacteria bacterium]